MKPNTGDAAPDDSNKKIGEAMEEFKQEAVRELTGMGMETEDGTMVEQPALCLVGKRKRISTQKGQDALAQIREFWAQCGEDGTLAALRSLAPDAQCFVAACHNFDTQEYDYWIAIETIEEGLEAPEGFEFLMTEESVYALFPCKGPALQSVFDRWAWVYRKWFPKGEYFHGTCLLYTSDAADEL